MITRNVITKTFLFFIVITCGCSKEQESLEFSNEVIKIKIEGSENLLWSYNLINSVKSVHVKGPVFEVEGKEVLPELSGLKLVRDPVRLRNEVTEYVIEGDLIDRSGLKLRLYFRIPDSNPVVKFRYELISDQPVEMTKSLIKDNLSYLSVDVSADAKVKEVHFSEFNEMVHSFVMSEREIDQNHFKMQSKLMGPLIAVTDKEFSMVLAYEHGSQVPDAFIDFILKSNRQIEVKAVKGNYYNGQILSNEKPFSTIWFDLSCIKGSEDQIASSYREFVLKYMTENLETRKPYIFYNTWNFQERNRHWNKKPYLADMTLNRMLKEIDIAHRMGIEVFVIDAGWFEKTGDWSPDKTRFPDELKTIKKQLDDYRMKLGLWFNPNAAAISSSMLARNRDCVKTWDGKEQDPSKVWETEESYGMCLVSKYRDDFADELIRIAKEMGVTYFKWDAISQYGCNDPRHLHGNETNAAEERAECFAFEIGRSMTYIVDKLCAAVPEAIVDFDITEGNRAVGLGFLAAGKYFLINNGPYYFNYDIPFDSKIDNWNIFFYPGPARGWICRSPLTFDKWIPTILFLTHYLPDDPVENQSISLGSLILGQNGIWGDLPSISEEGVEYFAKTLNYYKQVRDDITSATIIRDGAVGGSPEVYEKINEVNGRGAVVVFSSHTGKYTYLTHHKPDVKLAAQDGVDINYNTDGHALITLNFLKPDAKIIFFGVDN